MRSEGAFLAIAIAALTGLGCNSILGNESHPLAVVSGTGGAASGAVGAGGGGGAAAGTGGTSGSGGVAGSSGGAGGGGSGGRIVDAGAARDTATDSDSMDAAVDGPLAPNDAGTSTAPDAASGDGAACSNPCVVGQTACVSGGVINLCNSTGGACPAFTPLICGNNTVCERYAPAACVNPNWAEWPMPNSPSDVEVGAPNLEGYTNNQDGTVTDNITGLMWERSPTVVMNQAITQLAAVTYCSSLQTGGYADWRLPTVIELVSLLDLDNYMNTIQSTFFNTPVADSPYWSSTLVPTFLKNNPNYVYIVTLGGGTQMAMSSSASAFVRCVR